MPTPMGATPGNAQIEECLKRVSEAEHCLEQVASAQSALVEARRVLNELNAVPLDVNTSEFKIATEKASVTSLEDTANITKQSWYANGCGNTALRDLAAPTRPSIIYNPEWQEALTENQRNVLDSLKSGMAEDGGKQLGIAKDDVINCFRVFCSMDKDASNKISAQEMRDFLFESVGAERDDMRWEIYVEDLMAEHDKDRDCQVDFEEFLFLYSNMPGRRTAHLAARVHYAEDRMSDEFRVNIVGVRANDIMDYCRKEIKEERAFLAIPLIFALFVAFVVSVSLHRKNNSLSQIEEAFRSDVEENANFAFSGPIPFENGRMGHKTMYDVNSFADFWSWLDVGLIPLFFPESWDLSEVRANTDARCVSPFEALSDNGWVFNTSLKETKSGASFSSDIEELCSEGMPDATPPEAFFNNSKAPYLFFNSIVGGVRLRQERDDEELCPDEELYSHAYDTKCVKERSLWLLPDHDTALNIREELVNRPGGETQYLLSKTTQSEVRLQLRRLENSAWLDQRSAKVEVLFTTYNPHNDIFVALYINFFLTSAGHIHKVIKPIGIWMSPYTNVVQYIADSVWVLLVLKLIMDEIVFLVQSIRREGCSAGVKSHLSYSHLVNFISIAYSLVLMVWWCQHLVGVQNLRSTLMRADVDVHGSWSDPSDRDFFYEQVTSLTQHHQSMQVLLGFYPFVIGCRFFTAFSGQPRLAVVTDTLKTAWNDVLHFGIVMSAILMCYGVSASILFGREVEEYETLGRCFVSVMRVLLGDFDYVSLAEIGRPVSLLWFISFMVLLNLVMLNMLLAIIMDVYSTVKGSLDDDAETIFSQCYEIYRRWREKQQKKRVSLVHILVSLERQGHNLCLAGSDEYKLITVEAILNMVPGLERQQAQSDTTEQETNCNSYER